MLAEASVRSNAVRGKLVMDHNLCVYAPVSIRYHVRVSSKEPTHDPDVRDVKYVRAREEAGAGVERSERSRCDATATIELRRR